MSPAPLHSSAEGDEHAAAADLKDAYADAGGMTLEDSGEGAASASASKQREVHFVFRLLEAYADENASPPANAANPSGSASKQREEERVLSHYDVVLIRSDLDILAGPRFISGRIIAFYFAHLSAGLHDDDDLLLLPPSIPYFLSNLPDWASVTQVAALLRLASRRLVLLPVNDNPDASNEGGLHWSLLVFDRATSPFAPRFVHHDSARGAPNLSIARRLADALRPLLGTTVPLVQDHTPAQTNTYDCGVYAMAIAKAICAWWKGKGRGGDWLEAVKRDVDACSVRALRTELLELIHQLIQDELNSTCEAVSKARRAMDDDTTREDAVRAPLASPSSTTRRPGSPEARRTSQPQKRYVFVCHGSIASWRSGNRIVVGNSSLAASLFNSLEQMNPRLTKNYKIILALFDCGDSSDFDHGDVLVFPQRMVFRGMNVRDTQSFLEIVVLGGGDSTSWHGKPLGSSYAFICCQSHTHGDYALRECSVCGPFILSSFIREVEQQGLEGQVSIFGCTAVSQMQGDMVLFPAGGGRLQYTRVYPGFVRMIISDVFGDGSLEMTVAPSLKVFWEKLLEILPITSDMRILTDAAPLRTNLSRNWEVTKVTRDQILEMYKRRLGELLLELRRAAASCQTDLAGLEWVEEISHEVKLVIKTMHLQAMSISKSYAKSTCQIHLPYALPNRMASEKRVCLQELCKIHLANSPPMPASSSAVPFAVAGAASSSHGAGRSPLLHHHPRLRAAHPLRAALRRPPPRHPRPRPRRPLRLHRRRRAGAHPLLPRRGARPGPRHGAHPHPAPQSSTLPASTLTPSRKLAGPGPRPGGPEQVAVVGHGGGHRAVAEREKEAGVPDAQPQREAEVEEEGGGGGEEEEEEEERAAAAEAAGGAADTARAQADGDGDGLVDPRVDGKRETGGYIRVLECFLASWDKMAMVLHNSWRAVFSSFAKIGRMASGFP